MVSFIVGTLVGAILGYAFRGYISRTKNAAGAALAADAGKAIATELTKL
jgi:hypothetical protein